MESNGITQRPCIIRILINCMLIVYSLPLSDDWCQSNDQSWLFTIWDLSVRLPPQVLAVSHFSLPVTYRTAFPCLRRGSRVTLTTPPPSAPPGWWCRWWAHPPGPAPRSRPCPWRWRRSRKTTDGISLALSQVWGLLVCLYVYNCNLFRTIPGWG